MKFDLDIHNRRSLRLKGYDYSREGLYFITICAHEMECLFGEISSEDLKGREDLARTGKDKFNVGVGSSNPFKKVKLNKFGKIIDEDINKLNEKYQNIKCHEYIVMPNHIHFIIEILYKIEERTLGKIIAYFKYETTKKANKIMNVKNEEYFKIWHRNYYENIIRNEKAYLKVTEYIRNNPMKWEGDRYYMK